MTISELASLPSVKGSCVHNLPAEKAYNILLIQPNSTESMTTNCLQMVKEHLPSDCIVYGYTAPPRAPISIEGHLDGIVSATEIMRDAYAYIQQADAVLVGCFSDHPLINCIREEFEMPTCGIIEAAIYTARLLGGRFGIVTTVYRSQIRHYDAVRAYGLEGHCAGLLSTGLKVSELHTLPREKVLSIMKEVALKLVEDKDADVIILGCAGMTDMQNAIEEAVKKYNVPVIDGIVSGVNLLAGVVRSGLKTSKHGLFCSSLEARTARGQDWL